MSKELEESKTLPLYERRQNYDITPEELKFVLELILDFDYERAFLSIFELSSEDFNGDEGISIKARRIASRPEVQHAIVSEIQGQGELLFLRKEAIIARLWAEATDMYSKSSSRIKALETISKMQGTLSPEDERRIPPSVTVNVISGDSKTKELKMEDILGDGESIKIGIKK